MSSPTHVFISYWRGDEETAIRLRQALRADGFTIWWDDDLRAGQAWASRIDEALLRASAVIVLWSQEAAESRWVVYEAAVAKGRGTLTPARIKPCDIPEAFSGLQAADLTAWDGKEKNGEYRKLVDAIRSRQTSRARSLRRRTVLLAAVATGFLISGLALRPVVSPYSGQQQSSLDAGPGPAELAGRWVRRSEPPDAFRMVISQAGDMISSDVTYLPPDSDERVTEKLSGRYIESEDSFLVQIEKSTASCSETLHAWLRPVSSRQFALQIFASAGTCPPIIGPGSEQLWVRRADDSD